MILVKLEPVHEAVFVSADGLEAHFIRVFFVDGRLELDVVVELALAQVLRGEKYFPSNTITALLVNTAVLRNARIKECVFATP